MHEVAGPWGVRVCSERCQTCIFRPGNLMQLERGRVADMLAECESREGHITCHETMDGAEPAICHGFTETISASRSLALRYARATGTLVEVEPPTKDFLQ